MTTTPTTPTDGKRSPGRYWLDVAVETQDPHSMAGAALCGLLAILTERDEADGLAEAANDDYLELRREYDDLEAALGKRQQVIDDVLATCAKSKGQLAEKVRAVIDDAFKVPDIPAQPDTPDGTDPAGA